MEQTSGPERPNATALGDEQQLQRALGDCVLNSSWMWTVGGTLLSIPYGVRAKSLMPLVFFGTTGAMLDILQGMAICKDQRDALQRHMEAKKRMVAAAKEEKLASDHTFKETD